MAEAPDLKAGMIITLEPGLYEVHAGGVRLEDDFLVFAFPWGPYLDVESARCCISSNF